MNSGAAVSAGGRFEDGFFPYYITLMNCSFFGNMGAGGVLNFDEVDARVRNSIIWGNGAGPIRSTAGETRVEVAYSIVEGGFAGEGNIDADPLFVNPEAGDLYLREGSPAIDTGTDQGTTVGHGSNALPVAVPEDDLRGVARPQGEGVDIGAFEYNGPRTFTLTTAVMGAGTIDPAPGAHEYEEGTVVTLTATPAPGYEFDHWEGALTGPDNPAQLTLASDATVTAVFRMTIPQPPRCAALSTPAAPHAAPWADLALLTAATLALAATPRPPRFWAG